MYITQKRLMKKACQKTPTPPPICRPKIEEGFALGRFGRFAQDVQVGRDDTRKLGTTIGKAFGPLFRPLGTALPKEGKAENVAFQAHPRRRPDRPQDGNRVQRRPAGRRAGQVHLAPRP